MKWYKRDPDAFKGGTISLSLEEIGAYTLILDDIYCRNGQIPDDEHYVSRLLRCDVRVWRRIRARLLALNKLQSENNLLSNVRCTSVVSRYLVGAKFEGKSTKKGKKNSKRIQKTEVAPTGLSSVNQSGSLAPLAGSLARPHNEPDWQPINTAPPVGKFTSAKEQLFNGQQLPPDTPIPDYSATKIAPSHALRTTLTTKVNGYG
jgi:uncharacterized protein YdaU (DUF1376 family)